MGTPHRNRVSSCCQVQCRNISTKFQGKIGWTEFVIPTSTASKHILAAQEISKTHGLLVCHVKVNRRHFVSSANKNKVNAHPRCWWLLKPKQVWVHLSPARMLGSPCPLMGRTVEPENNTKKVRPLKVSAHRSRARCTCSVYGNGISLYSDRLLAPDNGINHCKVFPLPLAQEI